MKPLMARVVFSRIGPLLVCPYAENLSFPILSACQCPSPWVVARGAGWGQEEMLSTTLGPIEKSLLIPGGHSVCLSQELGRLCCRDESNPSACSMLPPPGGTRPQGGRGRCSGV